MTTRMIKLPGGREISYKQADAAVKDYVDKTNHAAFQLYDLTNDGPHDDLRPIDLLSLNALNAFAGSSPMTAMENLWKERGKVEAMVSKVTKEPLDELSATDLADGTRRLCEAIEAVTAIKLWGDTRASKLMHRLRPNICPIWDDRVGTKWYASRSKWTDFVEAVHENVLGPNREDLQRLAEKCRVPLLRAWDILLWKTPKTSPK
ncbi:MAG: DUF6308 family protein [Polyangia bacterium]